VQFKMVSVLGHKRARRSGALKDPLRANVRPYVVIKQFLSTTSCILAEFANVLLNYRAKDRSRS